MQEIMEDGSEGKTFVEDTIEELIPHIKKSLEDPKVKFIKVYRAKQLSCATEKEEDKFLAEEEKVDTGKALLEDLKKPDFLPEVIPGPKTKATLKIPRKR